MKKFISLCLILVISFSLTGCFKQDSEPVKAIEAFVSDIKSGNVEKTKAAINDAGNIIPNLSQNEWLKLMGKNLVYEIVSENVEKNSAMIKLKMSNTNIDLLTNNVIIKVSDDYVKNRKDISESDIKNKILSDMNSEIGSFNERIAKEFELKLEHSNNKWIIVTNSDFEYIVTGNADIKNV